MNSNRGYRIQWEGGDLTYFPVKGQILDHHKGKSVTLLRTMENFPSRKMANSGSVRDFFRPICLTLYMGTRCNLDCSYCYVPGKEQSPEIRLDPEVIKKAAEWVASNCKHRNRPFILGFHGGNEPLLYKKAIQQAISICRKVAEENKLECKFYCTTNGVISTPTAQWAAHTFSGITVSWDGPGYYHDHHRYLHHGKPTEEKVRKTVEHLQRELPSDSSLKIRVTVTDRSVDHLEEIVDYFDQYQVKHIELMPVYPDPTQQVPSGIIPDKEKFVVNFLKAKAQAEEKGMILQYAGSRLFDPHDKFCTVFQDNLTITPDGFLSACFLTTHGKLPTNRPYFFGKISKKDLEMHLDWVKLEYLINRASSLYEECKSCFNYYHCSKACPERCPVRTPGESRDPLDCRVEKWIGLASILEAAGHKVEARDLEKGAAFFQGIYSGPLDYHPSIP